MGKFGVSGRIVITLYPIMISEKKLKYFGRQIMFYSLLMSIDSLQIAMNILKTNSW